MDGDRCERDKTGAPQGSSNPKVGYAGANDGNWIQWNGQFAPNTFNRPIYGMTTTPTVPVPEPSTYALAAIAAAVMGIIARKRRAIARA